MTVAAVAHSDEAGMDTGVAEVIDVGVAVGVVLGAGVVVELHAATVSIASPAAGTTNIDLG